MGTLARWIGAELLLFIASRIRRHPLAPMHRWVRAGEPGKRACVRCGQTVGGGAPSGGKLLPCDEAICQDVLDE